LRDDVALFVVEQKAHGFSHTTISEDKAIDGDHGRIYRASVTCRPGVAALAAAFRFG